MLGASVSRFFILRPKNRRKVVRMAIWELRKSASYNHAPNFAVSLPTSASAYGKEHVTDFTPPSEAWTFSGKGLTDAEMAQLRTAVKTRHAVLTVTDSLGASYTGRFLNLTEEVNEGTALHSVSIQLRCMDNEAVGSPVVPFVFPAVSAS